MGKKSATKVEAAPAAIKATKPLKKGNNFMESEDEKPAPKAKEGTKKAEKDSSSDDSGSEESESEDAKETPKKKSSDVEMVDAEKQQESEDEKPAPKAKEGTKKAEKDSSSDDSGSEESESEDAKETPKKKSSDVEMVDAEKQQPKTPSTPATGGTKTLFVGNLPFQVERSDVEEFFKEAGQVVDVRFATNRDDGSFKGFGHVEFASAGEAQKALEFHGRPLLGRELRLDVAQERGERPAYTPQSGTGNNSRSGGGGGQEVFVKGFDSSLAPNDIKSALTEHFASCGEITRVSVPVDRETGGSRGIAYVEFKEGTEKAFELNGSDMGGWNLVVDQPRPKENNSGGGFNSGRSNSFSGGRDNFRGRGRGGRDGFRGRGRGGRDNGRGRPSFTSQAKKTVFSDE
ncbi:hypothetical protein IGI04_021459 [Brassica rapa subsp. trilocularis]|uniref:RRM domain-containing protein n=1 Tax=Brassica rapa subsp. trilocularis TaxID=1813537 RepID=A0ABQ7M0K3_BRACM|nr:hypothetical protein IGI04_021459 [Brassica rapa subsp. trilocularis]